MTPLQLRHGLKALSGRPRQWVEKQAEFLPAVIFIVKSWLQK
jgi:hypothetical protein